MDKDLKPGTLLRHYKGRYYKFLFFAKDSETLEDVVVYQALYGCNDIWVRPGNVFFGIVTVDGSEIRRFQTYSEVEPDNAPSIFWDYIC